MAGQELWKIPELYASTREARALGDNAPLGKDIGILIRNTLSRAVDIDLRSLSRRKRTWEMFVERILECQLEALRNHGHTL